jgi:hypothetical protein
VELERENVLGEISLDFASYGIQEHRIALDDGRNVTVGGGSTIAGFLRGGYRFSVGRAPSIIVLGGAYFGRHESDPLEDGDGDLGLLPSWQRIGVDLGLRANVPVGLHSGSRHVVFFAGAGVSPWSQWTIRGDSLGSSPAASPSSFAWSLGADVAFGDRWATRLTYEGWNHRIRFSGTGEAPVEPVLRDARVTEQTHALLLTFGRDF